MEPSRAERIVAALRERDVMAHVAGAGVYRAGIRVVIPDGREALWDTDGAAALEAQVLRDGVLVGFVPSIEGSEDFDDAQTVAAIAAADYDAESDPGSVGVPERPPAAERGGIRETVPRHTGRPGVLGRLLGRR
ncbi:MAG TPA: hypothetical protein VF288_11865 [Mycobacteriales bacterium]